MAGLGDAAAKGIVSGIERLEALVAEYERRFRIFAETSVQGKLVMRAYRPLFANTTAAQILGFDTRDELLTRLSVAGFLDDRTRADPAAAEAEALTGLRHGRARWRRKDGTPIVVSYASRPIVWNGDTSVIIAFADITELENAQSEAKQARIRAEAASEARTRFLSAASHHLRTPLHGVMGRLSLIADEADPDAIRHLAIDALHDARRMLVQIDDILDAAALATEAPHWARDEFDLADAVDDALQIATAPSGRPAPSIHVSAPLPGHIVMCGDRRRVSRIILAMLDEARRLSADHELRLTVQSLPDAASVRVETQTGDEPPAPAAEDDSFCGLALAKQLATALHGSLVATTDDAGRWIANATLPGDQNTGDAALADDTLRPLRVLAVEDNPGNRQLIGLILEHLGCEAILANDGAEAVALLAEGPVDVVVMDVMMPVMNGLEATRCIRGAGWAWSNVPIIAMTADSSAHARQAAEAAGVDAFLTKPVDVRRLAHALALLTGADGDPSVEAAEVDDLQRQNGQDENDDHGDRGHQTVSGTARFA